MARQLQYLREEPRQCSYLPDRCASLEHRILVDVTPDELDAMLVRGWRRFGPDYFRPACAPCHECVPIRIPTATFSPSKSQRRALRAMGGARAVIGQPRVDEQRLRLYERWHAFREEEREWAPAELDREAYFMNFAFPHPSVREIAYYDDSGRTPRLIGVGICDETPAAWSAVYFYFDPDYAARSPGVAHIAFQVKFAAAHGLDHVYLGYYVERCPSMRYKARFHPHERLIGLPGPEEEPRWIVISGSGPGRS